MYKFTIVYMCVCAWVYAQEKRNSFSFCDVTFLYFWGYNLNKSVKINYQMGKMKHKT